MLVAVNLAIAKHDQMKPVPVALLKVYERYITTDAELDKGIVRMQVCVQGHQTMPR